MFETRAEFEQKLPERIEIVKKRLHVGDMINYRVDIVEVLKIDGDEITIKGPYTEQVIDWEDVVEYNMYLCK